MFAENVYDAWLLFGKDKDHDPDLANHFEPTDAIPGSPAKIEVLRQRAARGQPLFHSQDRLNYNGFVGDLRLLGGIRTDE